MVEEFDLRLTLIIRWLVVPENKLKRTIIDDGQCKLMGGCGFDARDILYAFLVIVADRIVRRAGQEARERHDRVMVGIGHALVPVNPFLCQQVRIRPAVPGGPVFVMNIDHETVFCRFADSFVYPRGPPV